MSKQGKRVPYPARDIVVSMDKIIRPLRIFSMHSVAKVKSNHILEGLKVSLSKSSHISSAPSLNR